MTHEDAQFAPVDLVAARQSAGECFLNVRRHGRDQPEPVAAQPAPQHQAGHDGEAGCEADPDADAAQAGVPKASEMPSGRPMPQ